MKKLLLLAITAMIMTGCEEKQAKEDAATKQRWHGFHTEIIDSCEYIIRYTERVSGHQGFGQSFMSHKGNCKYCATRRKQELRELVEQIKDK